MELFDRTRLPKGISKFKQNKASGKRSTAATWRETRVNESYRWNDKQASQSSSSSDRDGVIMSATSEVSLFPTEDVRPQAEISGPHLRPRSGRLRHCPDALTTVTWIPTAFLFLCSRPWIISMVVCTPQGSPSNGRENSKSKTLEPLEEEITSLNISPQCAVLCLAGSPAGIALLWSSVWSSGRLLILTLWWLPWLHC